jgi:hypothetical protein
VGGDTVKIPVYLRIARDERTATWPSVRVDARTTVPARPLTDPDGKSLHTLIVKVNLDVPGELLKPRGHVEVDVVLGAEHVSELAVTAVPEEVTS